jgi:hypothetical protein
MSTRAAKWIGRCPDCEKPVAQDDDYVWTPEKRPLHTECRALHGCWHYDYERHCVQCDPASYGACEADCAVEHEHCSCDGPDQDCAVHPEEDEEEDEDDD